MISGRELCFSYNEDKPFIENLDVVLPKGKVTTIIGPNGSGKSTLLNLLNNLAKPYRGQVLIGGTDMKKLKTKEIARRIATVYQQNVSPEDIKVKELIYFGRTPHKKYFELENAEDEKIVQWAIASTNLEDLADKKLEALSGGERQRAWIAMALAQNPEVLFLDEPTTYLDIFHQLEILELVRRLNESKGITVAMVLHDLNQAMKYSDCLIVMKGGRVVKTGSPLEVIDEDLLKRVYRVEGQLSRCDTTRHIYFIPTKIC